MLEPVDGILVVGYDVDGRDHDDMLRKLLLICRDVNLKLNKGKCHFRCSSVPLFGKIISRLGVKQDPRKLIALKIPPPPTKKGIAYFP